MRRFATFLMVLVVALLPLRGMASLIADPCGPVHVHAPAAEAAEPHCHEEAGTAHAAPQEGQHGDPQVTCAHCATCCSLGTTLPSAASAGSGTVPGVERIPFRSRHAAGIFPPLLDRPPLAL